MAAGNVDLDPGACGAGTTNFFFCYVAPSVGVQGIDGAAIDADFNSWKDATPQITIDYGGTVTVANACAAAPTGCPAQ